MVDIGRAPSGQALAVPATPANAADGPARFDPSREASFLSELERRYLMATPAMSFATAAFIARKAGDPSNHGGGFSGFARRHAWLFQKQRRIVVEYRLSRDGYLVCEAAIATEAGTAETSSGSVHEGAGPQEIAQGSPQ